MTIASGLLKSTAWKKQAALGAPASGSGGKQSRHVTSVFKAERDTFENDEKTTHHQSTGLSYGLKKADGQINGLLSAGTFADFFGSILEKDFAAVTPGVAAAATTVAVVSGFKYTVTRGAGSWITDGLKIGNVVRITGAGVHANNINKNLLIVDLTALVCTVIVLNETAMTAEGPIATYVLTVVGKKSYTPLTGHTKDYYSVEEWYSDLARSELFADMRVGSIAVSMPATGNATVTTSLVGLSRTTSGARVLTTPTLTTTAVMTAVNGAIYIGGAAQAFATGIDFTIDNSAANAGAVIGSNSGTDVLTGRIKVSGTLTAQFDSVTLQALYDAETNTNIVIVLTADQTATADCLSVTMPRVKLTGDAPDDGEERPIVRTYPFTAEYYAAGGASSPYDAAILSINDSAA